MRKLVGKVTDEEKKEIQLLFERRNGLVELAKVIKDDESIYERVIADMGSTSRKFQQWWDENSAKYKWESAKGASWEIDFDSNEIYLVD